jgi:hypothetical protein
MSSHHGLGYGICLGEQNGMLPRVYDSGLYSAEYRDAWAKHRELDSYEAKWLYVDALLKVNIRLGMSVNHHVSSFYQVLRKYSDKTIAMTLVQELESYGGDPSNIIMSRKYVQSAVAHKLTLPG